MIRLHMGMSGIIRVALMVWLVGGSMVSGMAHADTVRRQADGDDPMRKAQYLLRQLNQEKEALQAEKLQLQGDLEHANARVGELEQELEKKSAALDTSREKIGQLVERVNRDHENIVALREKYRNTMTVLEASNRDNEHLINAVQERNQWIDTCRSRNNSLYEANIELLGLYENKGFAETLAQREPVTQIGAVRVESEVQEYQFRLEDLRMGEFADSGGGSRPSR